MYHLWHLLTIAFHGGKLRGMGLAERGSGLYRRTIGSGKFEHFSREPLALLIATLGIILGPQAIIEAINQFEGNNVAVGIVVSAKGTLEIGVATSLGVANIRSRGKVKPPTDS